MKHIEFWITANSTKLCLKKTLKHIELIWHNLQNTASGGNGQNAAPSTITLPNCSQKH